MSDSVPDAKRRKIDVANEASSPSASNTSRSIDEATPVAAAAQQIAATDVLACTCHTDATSVVPNSFCPLYRKNVLQRFLDFKGCHLPKILELASDEHCISARTTTEAPDPVAPVAAPVDEEKNEPKGTCKKSEQHDQQGGGPPHRGLHIRVRSEEELAAALAEQDSSADDSSYFAYVPQEAVFWDGLPAVRVIEAKIKETVSADVLEACGFGPAQHLWTYLVALKAGLQFPEQLLRKQAAVEAQRIIAEFEEKLKGFGGDAASPFVDEHNGFLGYVASLPPLVETEETSEEDAQITLARMNLDNPVHWPVEQLTLNLGEKSNLRLETLKHKAVLDRQQATVVGPLFGITKHQWRWARSIYTSRAFPAALVVGARAPVLLPLIDVFNHAHNHPVKVARFGTSDQLRAADAAEAAVALLSQTPSINAEEEAELESYLPRSTSVPSIPIVLAPTETLRAAGALEGVVVPPERPSTDKNQSSLLTAREDREEEGKFELSPGAEVFNCYGDKGNEGLLLNYGFVTTNNHDDCVHLQLSAQVSDKERCRKVARVLKRCLAAILLSDSTSGARTTGGCVSTPQEILAAKNLDLVGLEAQDTKITIGPFFLHHRATCQYSTIPTEFWQRLGSVLGGDTQQSDPPVVEGNAPKNTENIQTTFAQLRWCVSVAGIPADLFLVMVLLDQALKGLLDGWAGGGPAGGHADFSETGLDDLLDVLETLQTMCQVKQQCGRDALDGLRRSVTNASPAEQQTEEKTAYRRLMRARREQALVYAQGQDDLLGTATAGTGKLFKQIERIAVELEDAEQEGDQEDEDLKETHQRAGLLVEGLKGFLQSFGQQLFPVLVQGVLQGRTGTGGRCGNKK